MTEIRENERLQLLEEAHVQHRQAVRELRGLVSRLYKELGIEEHEPLRAGPDGPRTLEKRLRSLEQGGLSWTTQEAIRSIEQLTKLRYALDEIFDPEASR